MKLIKNSKYLAIKFTCLLNPSNLIPSISSSFIKGFIEKFLPVKFVIINESSEIYSISKHYESLIANSTEISFVEIFNGREGPKK